MKRTLSIAAFCLLLLSLFLCKTVSSEALQSSSAADDGKEETSAGKPECETLKNRLTYKQDTAPRDISAVLSVVIAKVNREISGVTHVEVKWTGSDIHRRVGEHLVETSVTRTIRGSGDDGAETKQCFMVSIVIYDTDECTLPAGHVMRHKCHSSSTCVNTLGGYDCVCPLLSVYDQKAVIKSLQQNVIAGKNASEVEDKEEWEKILSLQHSHERNDWELSLPPSPSGSSSSSSSKTRASQCTRVSSTHACCSFDPHGPDGEACRQTFRCGVDPCGSKTRNNCVSQAQCERETSPLLKPNYKCLCPEGFIGNGLVCENDVNARDLPRVKFDGVTLTKESQKKEYCGCNKPIVDVCAGVECPDKHEICVVSPQNTPSCVCKPGYMSVPEYGCVDETPPVLKLRCDPDGTGISVYRQGDSYQECAVDIQDENAEDYFRSLNIQYDRPLGQCFVQMGTFKVNYTVATPWTTPSFVSVVRTVQVEDIDECAIPRSKIENYNQVCPPVIPHCDTHAGAVCRNTIGSYTCECPPYTTGDGFLPITDYGITPANEPEGYKGGTGCLDTTKPQIKLKGPNPKVFRVCKCSSLKGLMSAGSGSGDAACPKDRNFESDIRDMIQATNGLELCSSGSETNPSYEDCFSALDTTYNDTVDLTARVVMGDLTFVERNVWKIPYDVVDDAGNEAETVWREVIVEEVTLEEFGITVRLEQEEIRRQELKKMNEHMEQAIIEAVQKPRAGSRERSCPSCPKCDVCPPVKEKGPDQCDCDSYCEAKNSASKDQTCTSASVPRSDGNKFTRSLNMTIISMEEILPPLLIIVLVCTVGCIVLLFIRLLWVFITRRNNGFTKEDEERERAMLAGAVTYYRSPDPATSRAADRATVSNGNFPAQSPDLASRGNQEDVYSNMSPITPSRYRGLSTGGGDGRNPWNQPRDDRRTGSGGTQWGH
eukprot:CAMPEP_0195528386 /NCGR_PEP_ID=MMETSP0794_2-20130614/30492_1 /TAXON_ID=515487 /ORGANISM="Stephanopyxis turris, Strain CCMP 815" /LENGTH=939 /DNA_ID=CAMNT_0040659511 /DNA_START=45 /DNA_END=2864 /DNA_ORIENTATION=+